MTGGHPEEKAAPAGAREFVRRRATLLAAVLYGALTLVLTYPLSTSPARLRLPSGPDPDLTLWILAWDVHAFVHQPLSIFDANIYHPQHATLAYSENLIGSAVVAAPVIWLTGNLVLAYNLVVLLSCGLCGLGAYVLARRLGIGTGGALVSGLVFAFSPTRLLRISQLHLGPVQWVPFGLASLHAYLDGGSRRDLRLAVAFFALQALTSGHAAVFMGLAFAVVLSCRLALGRPVAPARPLGDFGVTGLVLLLPAALVALPYVSVQRDLEMRGTLLGWGISSASFLASPSRFHSLVLSVLGQARINDVADAYLFPGYLPLALAIAALAVGARGAESRGSRRPAGPWRLLAWSADATAIASALLGWLVFYAGPLKWRMGPAVIFSAHDPWRPLVLAALMFGVRLAMMRKIPLDARLRLRRALGAVRRWTEQPSDAPAIRRREGVLAYGLLAVVSYWLSIGPPLGLWRFVYWLPGLSFIREPSRFTIVGTLGLAVLAGFGFERLARRRRPAVRAAAAVAACTLLVAEFAAMPLAVEPNDVSVPAVDRWLDTRPKPFVVAEVPLPRPTNLGAMERRQTMYMLHSTAHFQKTVHGYSGTRPAVHRALYWDLQGFPDERSLHALAVLGVTYVVVHTDLYAAGEWSQVEERIGRFPAWLRLEYAAGAGRAYSLHPPPDTPGR